MLTKLPINLSNQHNVGEGVGRVKNQGNNDDANGGVGVKMLQKTCNVIYGRYLKHGPVL